LTNLAGGPCPLSGVAAGWKVEWKRFTAADGARDFVLHDRVFVQCKIPFAAEAVRFVYLH